MSTDAGDSTFLPVDTSSQVVQVLGPQSQVLTTLSEATTRHSTTEHIYHIIHATQSYRVTL